jgi:hypothetical protein
MPVKLNSTGGGSVTLTTPSTATDYTATFPANTGNVVTDSATQTLTNKTLTSPVITGASVSSMASSVITSGTSQASTSGTSIDFTGIPSWVKRITVMFNGVSTNGTSNLLVQIGSTSFTTSGYLGSSADGPSLTATLFTSGFGIRTGSAAAVVHGTVVISIVTGNTWVAAGTLARSDGAAFISTAGTITLSGTLDRLRITTVNGTDAFDAGSINILYE